MNLGRNAENCDVKFAYYFSEFVMMMEPRGAHAVPEVLCKAIAAGFHAKDDNYSQDCMPCHLTNSFGKQ